MTETDEYVWVTRAGAVSKTYHTDPDCAALKAANNPRKTTITYPNRRECKHCHSDMDHGNQYTRPSDTVCFSCGSKLNVDGDCEWCERYEAVMGPYA